MVKKDEPKFCKICNRPIVYIKGCGFLLEDLTPQFLQSGICVNCVKRLTKFCNRPIVYIKYT